MNDSTSPRPAAARVKICGIMCLEDALAAARYGADYLGYVFYKKSARNMTPDQVREIVGEVRRQFPELKHVGVMVDESAESAAAIVTAADLEYAQLHGQETPETVAAVRSSGIGVIKAFRFGAKALPVRPGEFEADYYLCDTYDPAAAGGTGQAFDHGLLPPDLPRERLFLAGGLTFQNVAEAISTTSPFAVDVSSGVEEAPGRKSHRLVEQFLRAAKG